MYTLFLFVIGYWVFESFDDAYSHFVRTEDDMTSLVYSLIDNNLLYVAYNASQNINIFCRNTPTVS